MRKPQKIKIKNKLLVYFDLSIQGPLNPLQMPEMFRERGVDWWRHKGMDYVRFGSLTDMSAVGQKRTFSTKKNGGPEGPPLCFTYHPAL